MKLLQNHRKKKCTNLFIWKELEADLIQSIESTTNILHSLVERQNQVIESVNILKLATLATYRENIWKYRVKGMVYVFVVLIVREVFIIGMKWYISVIVFCFVAEICIYIVYDVSIYIIHTVVSFSSFVVCFRALQYVKYGWENTCHVLVEHNAYRYKSSRNDNTNMAFFQYPSTGN